MTVDLGEKIYNLRVGKQLTQKQLAEKTGISSSMVSSYESGGRQPSYESLVRIAKYFRISMDYLFGTDNMDSGKYVDITGLTPEKQEAVETLVDLLRGG